MDSRTRAAHVLLFVTPLMWAANYIVARKAVGVIEPHMLAFLRWLLAFAIMLPLAWPALRLHQRRWRREWPELLLLGALGMWICGAFVYLGAQTTSAVNIGLLYSLSPVLIAAASVKLFGETLSGRQILGVVLALAGTVLILAKGSLTNLQAVRFTRGDLWIVAAVIAWTVYSLVLMRKKSVLDPFARTTLITAAGLLVLAPMTAVEAAYAGLPPVNLTTLTLVLVVALLPGLGAYQAYAFMQRQLGAARTGLVLYLGPLYAALTAWVFLGEPPAWFHVIGAGLILPGIWLATRGARSRRPGALIKATATE
jgi:drug/metabolite transporter (DMT)-like permease